MTAMQRRVMSRPALPAADVAGRIQVRNASAAFESSTRAQLEAAITSRTWSQGCAECGSVLTFHGSLAEWLSKSAAWPDVHECEAVA